MELFSDTMEYTIRVANAADYAYCYRLTKRNMFELICRHWGGWVSAEFRQSFNPRNVTMVIVKGRRAGYLSVRQDEQGLYVENFQLSPKLQGKGIGSKILGQFVSSHDNELIQLTTFSDNPARRLYERLGFVITVRKDDTLRMAKHPNKRK